MRVIRLEKLLNRYIFYPLLYAFIINLKLKIMNLYHGTNWEALQSIFKEGRLGYVYGDGSKGIYLTPVFENAFLFGHIIIEVNLPFQNKIEKHIPNTDSGEYELFLNTFIPLKRIKKIHFPVVDYDYEEMLENHGLIAHD